MGTSAVSKNAAARIIKTPATGRVKKIAKLPREIKSACLSELSIIGPNTRASRNGAPSNPNEHPHSPINARSNDPNQPDNYETGAHQLQVKIYKAIHDGGISGAGDLGKNGDRQENGALLAGDGQRRFLARARLQGVGVVVLGQLKEIHKTKMLTPT